MIADEMSAFKNTSFLPVFNSIICASVIGFALLGVKKKP